MRIVLVLKPYAIEVYTRENNTYTLRHVESATRIDGELVSEYEKRMVFVCKKLATDIRLSSFFKETSRTLKGVDVVLSSPWCTYDVVQVEKDFGKKTKITDTVLKSMFLKKDEKDLYVVESYTSNILLNGYKVPAIDNQIAETVAFQYVHVYAKTSFITPLIHVLESIFHTHKVFLTSIYGLTEFVSHMRVSSGVSEIQIILEEESVDVSYIYDGLHVVNMFVPYSYAEAEHDIAMNLSAHNDVVQDILISRGESMQQRATTQVDKNAKKLWPDLDAQVKEIVNTSISNSLEKIVQHVRDCIDTIDIEYIKSSTRVQVYCVNKNLVLSYGIELAHKIATDPYITMKVHSVIDDDSVISLF